LITFSFKQDKAIEAVLYVVGELGGLDIGLLSEVLYKADKVHLCKYGRFIYGETYAAIPSGIAAMNVFGLILSLSANNNAQLPFKIGNGKVIGLRESDMDELSESDLDCLSEGIGAYHLGKERLGTWDNAWCKANGQINTNKRFYEIQVEDIARQCEGADDLLDYLKEMNDIEAIWR
jgi:hypothetical protein